MEYRVQGAERITATINWTEEKELSFGNMDLAQRLREQQEAALGRFRTTAKNLKWLQQYVPESGLLRHMPMLMAGKSRSGKTKKACSIFGQRHTLAVNCQGLGKNLPSLREFRRSEHRCIVFDEISSDQVLANKLVFQAGIDKLTLAQSQCNAHAYDVWLYGVPMILCSNFFQMASMPHAPMAEEDVEYLEKNIIDASLPDNKVWYYRPGESTEEEDEQQEDS